MIVALVRIKATDASVAFTMQQTRARDRHRRILDAALRVFSRRGYRDASVDDIADESRTSKGRVYFHFPGKEAIFLALPERLDDAYAALRPLLMRSVGVVERPHRSAEEL